MAEKSIVLPEGSKRTPMGKVRSTTTDNGDDKHVPHYLRASTGSCHDSCKYGGKHSFEEKAKRPVLKKLSPRDNDRVPVEIFVSPRPKKIPLPKVMRSVSLKSHAPDTSKIVKRDFLLKSSGDPIRMKVATKLVDVQNVVMNKKLSEKMRMIPAVFKAKSLLEPSRSLKLRNPKATATSSTLTASQASQKETATVSKKITTSFSLKPDSVKQKGSSSVISRGLSGIRGNQIKTGKKNETAKVVPKKIVMTRRASMPPRLSLNRVGSQKQRSSNVLKKQNSKKEDEVEQCNDDKVEEKTLYVIKLETENELLQSNQNESCVDKSSSSLPPSSMSPSPHPLADDDEEEEEEESMYTVSDEEDESCGEPGIETLDSGLKKPRQRQGRVGEDMDDEAVKLRFRRGKVVDLKSESNSGRRLKFRRGRVIGEKEELKSDDRRRLKSSKVDDHEESVEAGGVKVNLRHQEQEKRDAQASFNNVIEETANKLVETRKSKVKALVGAFETVISLQENKPSGNVTT